MLGIKILLSHMWREFWWGSGRREFVVSAYGEHLMYAGLTPCVLWFGKVMTYQKGRARPKDGSWFAVGAGEYVTSSTSMSSVTQAGWVHTTKYVDNAHVLDTSEFSTFGWTSVPNQRVEQNDPVWSYSGWLWTQPHSLAGAREGYVVHRYVPYYFRWRREHISSSYVIVNWGSYITWIAIFLGANFNCPFRKNNGNLCNSSWR